MYRLLRVISYEPFFVVSVENIYTKEQQIVYTTDPVDESKTIFTYEDLKPIVP